MPKHNTAGCTTDDDCPLHKPNCDITDGTCKPCVEGKCFHCKIDGSYGLKLIPGCTSNSHCSCHEPTCDTLTRTCYNCNHYCKYYNCNGRGKRWIHQKCRDHSQLCLPSGLCVDRPKAGLQYLNIYFQKFNISN